MKTKYTITIKTINNVKRFIEEVSQFKSDVDIVSGRYVCDAKSIMGVFSFDLTKPVDIVIHSKDEDELKRFEEMMKKFEG